MIAACCDHLSMETVHMNPNSQHQMWSLWTWTITPQRTTLLSFPKRTRQSWEKQKSFAEVKANAARFGAKAFGTASQMWISHLDNGQWIIKVRTEGHPVHDPQYVQYQRAAWERFFQNGFGNRSKIEFHAKLEAGDAQEGKPADQLIILPPLAIEVENP